MRKYLYLALVGAMALASCRKDDTIEPQAQPQTEPSSPQGPVVGFEMSAEAETFVAGDEIALRSMSLLSGGSTTNGFVRYTDSPVNKGVFYFRRKDSNTTTARVLNYKLTAKDNGRKADIRVDFQSFTLDNNESFATGEWYVSAVLGQGDKFNTASPYFSGLGFDKTGQNNVKYVQWQDRNSTTMIPMDVPLLLGWTKMTSPSTGHMTIGKVTLRPAGALMKIRPQSELVDDIMVYGLALNSADDVAFSGNFSAPSGTLVAGAMPEFAPASGSKRTLLMIDTNTDYTTIDKMPLSSGTRSDKHVYIWMMPRKTTLANNETPATVQWICAGEPVHLLDVNQTSGQKPLFDGQYSVAQRLKPTSGKLESGKYYFSFVGVKSDLMITEYHSGVGQYAITSIVELYNPTLETIDLSNYALGRAELKNDKFFLFPSEVTKDKGNGYGILLPCDFKDRVDESRWGNNATYGSIAGVSTLPTKYYSQATSLKFRWVSAINKANNSSRTLNPATGYDKTYDSREGLDNPTLEPGKVALLCSRGYIKDNYGSLVWVSQNQWWDAVGAQAEYSYGKDYCKYIVGAMPSDPGNTGVLDFFDWESGPVLFRLMPNGQKVLIDVNVPLIDSENPLELFKRIFTTNGTNYKAQHFRIRKDGVHFPNTLFRDDQWWVSQNPKSVGWYQLFHKGNLGMRRYPLPDKGDWSQGYGGYTDTKGQQAKQNWPLVPRWTRKGYSYNKNSKADTY